MTAPALIDLDWLEHEHATKQLCLMTPDGKAFVFMKAENPVDEEVRPGLSDATAYVSELIRLARLGQEVAS